MSKCIVDHVTQKKELVSNNILSTTFTPYSMYQLPPPQTHKSLQFRIYWNGCTHTIKYKSKVRILSRSLINKDVDTVAGLAPNVTILESMQKTNNDLHAHTTIFYPTVYMHSATIEYNVVLTTPYIIFRFKL